MAFDPTSRYARCPLLTVQAADGTPHLLAAPRVAPEPPASGAGHVVRAGERLDLLARAVLGDTTAWWRIADANPWPDATQLERPGQTIALPGAGP